MKYLNIIITVCFMITFAGIFYKTEYLLTTPISKSPELSMNKDFGLGKTFIFINPKENEYIKGGIGAVMGWAIKNICDYVWKTLRLCYTKLFRKDEIC